MRRRIAALCGALSLAIFAGHPHVQALPDQDSGSVDRMPGAASVLGAAHPREYLDYPETFFFYYTTYSLTNCAGNASCDIVNTQYYGYKDDPEHLIVIAEMAGPTDSSMSDNDTGGIVTYFDSDSDHSDWDYRVWTETAEYPLDAWIPSKISRWTGSKWVETPFEASYKRGPDAWILHMDYVAVGITSASMAVRAVDAQGNEDMSPGSYGTPKIPIAALAAGAPGQPQNLKAKAGMESVSLTWSAPTYEGASSVTGYTVTATPGGATCTATAPSGCTVTGLVGREDYDFTVTATNAQGTGPASDSVEATPKSPYPEAPEITKTTYKGKGKVRDVTITWSRPPGATGYEIRWDLNGTPWTAWQKTQAKSVTIKGLKWDKFTHFEVRAVNANGAGPVADELLYFGPR